MKAIYQKYLGWYDANPVNLDPLPPVESGKKYVEYMGGAEAILTRARADFAKAGFSQAGPDGILQDAQGRRLSFTLSYMKQPMYDAWMLRLKEEAKKAGVEYTLVVVPGAGHGLGDKEFKENVLPFFEKHLKRGSGK